MGKKDAEDESSVAEWKKVLKQLKSKDTTTRLAGVEKCTNDILKEGHCLPALLQTCVPSKKNTEQIIQAAVLVLERFINQEEKGTLLLLEAVEKKLSLKLITDLINVQEAEDVVKSALTIYTKLIAVVDERQAAELRHTIDLNKTLSDITLLRFLFGIDFEHSAFGSLATIEGLPLALASTMARITEDHLQVLCTNALQSSTTKSTELLEIFVIILNATAFPTHSLLNNNISAIIQRLATIVKSDHALADDETMHLVWYLAIVERLLTQNAATSTFIKEDFPLDELAKSLASTSKCLLRSSLCCATAALLVAKCVNQLVNVLGPAAYDALLKTALPRTFLQLLTVSGAGPTQRTWIEATLHFLSNCDHNQLVLGTQNEHLSAKAIIEALNADDVDSSRRVVRFVHCIASANAQALADAGIAPVLMRFINAFATADSSATSNESISAATAAVYACRILSHFDPVQLDIPALETALFSKDLMANMWQPTHKVWENNSLVKTSQESVRAALARLLAKCSCSAKSALALAAEYPSGDLRVASLELLATISIDNLVSAGFEKEEEVENFKSPLDAIGKATTPWKSYINVLALPLAILADKDSSLELIGLALNILTRLTQTSTLDSHRFAVATIAAGGLVSLAALSPSLSNAETLAISLCEIKCIVDDEASESQYARQEWAQLISAKGPDARRCQNLSSPLLAAAAGSAADLVDSLLGAGADIESRQSSDGATALIIALRRGDATIVKALLHAGADADARDDEGTPVLQYALLAPDPDALQTVLNTNGIKQNLPATAGLLSPVLDAGADLEVADGRGKFPLHWIVEGVTKTVQYDHAIDCDLRYEGNDAEVLLELLLSRASTNAVNCCDQKGMTPLHAAIWQRQPKLAELLIQAGAQPNLCDSNLRLPLHSACATRNQDMMNLLLELGTHFPKATAVYSNARAGASRAEKQRLDASRTLKNAYDRATMPPVIVNRIPTEHELLCNFHDDQGRTALHYAAGAASGLPKDECMSGQLLAALVRRIIASADPSQLLRPCPAEYNASIIHIAIATLGDHAVPTLAELFKSPCIPSDKINELIVCFEPNDQNKTVFDHILRRLSIQSSYSNKREAAVSPKIDASDDFKVECLPAPDDCVQDIPPPEGQIHSRRVLAPLHIAIARDASLTIQWLLKNGASLMPDYAEPSPLTIAGLLGATPETVQSLLVDCQDSTAKLDAVAAFHTAAMLGHAATLTALLEIVDVDTPDKRGRTALLSATLNEKYNAVAVLLSAGASLCNGICPLSAAIQLHSLELVSLILAAPQTKVSPSHIIQAERIHMDAALILFKQLTAAEREGSPELELVNRTVTIIKELLENFQIETIPTDQHLDPCFAQGLFYFDVLLAQETAEDLRRRQENAAVHLQCFTRQRAARSAVAARRKTKADRKARSHKKESRKKKKRVAAGT